MEKIARRLGYKEDAIFFNKRSVLVRNTINHLLFDKTKGIYVDSEGSSHVSLHANMFPLVFDIVPAEHVKSVLKFVKSRGMACSVYGAQYLLEALYKHGEADYAMHLITDTTRRSWWNMIQSGSTMTLEAWDMKYKPNSDWNHAWGTAPANIVTRFIWGITPALPGFSKVHIEPQLSNLTFSSMKVPTIKGTIFVNYVIIKGKRHFVIQLPKGMSGDFVLRPIILKYRNLKIGQNTMGSRKYILHPGINVIDKDL